MYKIINLDSYKHNIYASYTNAQIDAINWYIAHISICEIGVTSEALYIQQFINAINSKNYTDALKLGHSITGYLIYIENMEIKSPSLNSFSNAELKILNNNVKKIIFK